MEKAAKGESFIIAKAGKPMVKVVPRSDFVVDPAELRERWLQSGYIELGVLGSHAVAIGRLPLIHRDPFDRMLVAQATVEGMDLLTSEAIVARSPGPVRYFNA